MELENNALLQTGCFINNEWLQTGNFAVVNPSSGETIAQVSDATEQETLLAIDVAEKAFPGWSQKPSKERAEILKKWYQLILQNIDDLALLLTSEQGKPLSEAKGEVQYGASFIEWFAEECRRTYGEVIPSPVVSKRFITIKQPVGVVAAITPWNFPVAMITRKIAPALAAGCTVVLKSAEDTPLCALALAYLAKEAGFPPGVLNVIPTSKPEQVGKILCTHPAIQKISFTGSTEVGRILMQQAASTVKKLSLELGGNAPMIVFDDADLEKSVQGTLASKYRNAGQTCVCVNRIFIQKGIYNFFIEKYKQAVAKLKVGDGTGEEVEIGPLINEAALEKVERLMENAKQKGAEILLGGKQHKAGKLFYEPTIISQCTAEMDLSHEEIFGPVSAIYVFETEAEAIEMANNTEYGLAAYFFTENIHRSWRVAEQLQYGIIGINEGIISYAEAPFGGIKQSGFGKEGSLYGMEEYLIVKYLCMGGG